MAQVAHKYSRPYVPFRQVHRFAQARSFQHQKPDSTTGKWTFDTAKEAEYPRELCVKVSAVVIDAILAKGYVPLPSVLSTADEHPITKKLRLRATVGLFVRGNRLPSMISEYLKIVQLPLTPSSPAIGVTFQMQDGATGRVLRHQFANGVKDGSEELSHGAYMAVGVHRSPQQFAD